MSEDRFCVNCKHHRMTAAGEHECRHHSVLRTDWVTGDKFGASCKERRAWGMCGTDGIHFDRQRAPSSSEGRGSIEQNSMEAQSYYDQLTKPSQRIGPTNPHRAP